jgi:nitroreductase
VDIAEGERPRAYILIVGDPTIKESFGVDHGIAGQSNLLGAVEAGLGGCMIGSAKGDALAVALGIPERFQILLVITLEKPVETGMIESVEPGEDLIYYRDENDVHHVPKRGLDELILHEV